MQQPVVQWASQARLIRGSSTGLLGPASAVPGPCSAISVRKARRGQYVRAAWYSQQLACPKLELEWLVPLPGAVKGRAILQSTHIVHCTGQKKMIRPCAEQQMRTAERNSAGIMGTRTLLGWLTSHLRPLGRGLPACARSDDALDDPTILLQAGRSPSWAGHTKQPGEAAH